MQLQATIQEGVLMLGDGRQRASSKSSRFAGSEPAPARRHRPRSSSTTRTRLPPARRRRTPAPLRQAAAAARSSARAGLLLVVREPDLGQALVGRQLAGGAGEELALHAGGDAGLAQHVDPERGDRDVGRLRQPQHQGLAGPAAGAAPSAARSA
jgi:hypothetical protein